MKKIICITLIFVFFTGCSNNVKNSDKNVKIGISNNYLDTIDKDQIEYAKVEVNMAYNMADPIQLKKHATNVFLASINSIDSATCNLEGYEYSPIPFTLGKMEILKNYIGEAEGLVNFSRSGGTVTIDEFNRNAPELSVSRRERLQKEKNKEINYMNIKLINDIELEVNKTYLIYATYNEEYDRYEMIGFEYGSREVEGYNLKTRTLSDSATILNNETKETESFEEYVKSYLDL